MTQWVDDVRSALADIGDASASTLASIYGILGNPATAISTSIASVLTKLYDTSTKNVMTDRDMPYLSEFWTTEALVAASWEETLDGGTGAFGTADGYMYYDLDTIATTDTDVYLNSKYRWQFRPAIFSDTNEHIEAINLEFLLQIVSAVTLHDNTHFLLGFSSAKSNDITQNNLCGFYLDSDALKGKTDDGGAESTTGDMSATLTNWNKFKIRISAASVVFSLNEVAQAALTTNLPDEAMYIILGTRAETDSSVGLNVGNVRCWYEEVV